MVLPDTHTQRPHYGGHVAAGAWDIAPIPAEADTWRDILDIAPDYDFTATATGDSMLPLIHSGDTLYCRRLYRGDPLRTRAIYLFATPDGTLVKQLLLPTSHDPDRPSPSPDTDRTDTDRPDADRPDIDPDADRPDADHIPYDDHLGTLTLRSLNPDYTDIELPRQDLIGIAKVVATFHPLAGDIADPAPGLRPGTPSAPAAVPAAAPSAAAPSAAAPSAAAPSAADPDTPTAPAAAPAADTPTEPIHDGDAENL